MKIKRAQHHIADLEGQFKTFVARKPHRFSIKNDPKTGQTLIQIRFVEAPPDNLIVVIGDTIHNLRTALDHMIWALIGWDGGAQNKHLTFPCRDNRTNYEAGCNGIQTPSQWIRDFIIAFEAFPGGKGEIFCRLHEMDVTDKHRAIRPVLRGTGHPDFTIYNTKGEPCLAMSGNQFIGGMGDAAPIMNVPVGYSVELDGDTDCPPSIFFSDTLGDGEVFSVLDGFRHSVSNALEDFKYAVAKNPKV